MPSPTMPPRLPQELIEAFIDEAASSKANLRACALTHPSWTRRSHQHLFRSITLDTAAKCALLRKIVEARHCIGAYVRRIVLEAPGIPAWCGDSPDLGAALTLFPDVHTLSVEGPVVEQDLRFIRPEASPELSSVADLSLDHCIFPSVNTFHATITSFVNLRSLSLLYVAVAGGRAGWIDPAEPLPEVAASLRLRELRIHVPHIPHDGAGIIGHVLGKSIASLESLQVTVDQESSAILLQTMIPYIASSLLCLNLDVMYCRGDVDAMLHQLDMNLLPRLVSLIITVCPGSILAPGGFDINTWVDYTAPFLDSLPKNILRDITIQVHVWPAALHYINAVQWESIDHALTKPAFSALEHLTIVVQTRPPEWESRKRVVDGLHARLPSLVPRNMVRIDFQDPTRGP